MNNKKPLSFYELLSAILVFLALTEDPFYWWFTPAPVFYQWFMEQVGEALEAKFRAKFIKRLYDQNEEEAEKVKDIIDEAVRDE